MDVVECMDIMSLLSPFRPGRVRGYATLNPSSLPKSEPAALYVRPPRFRFVKMLSSSPLNASISRRHSASTDEISFRISALVLRFSLSSVYGLFDNAASIAPRRFGKEEGGVAAACFRMLETDFVARADICLCSGIGRSMLWLTRVRFDAMDIASDWEWLVRTEEALPFRDKALEMRPGMEVEVWDGASEMTLALSLAMLKSFEPCFFRRELARRKMEDMPEVSDAGDGLL